jgi:hypothetical protein
MARRVVEEIAPFLDSIDQGEFTQVQHYHQQKGRQEEGGGGVALGLLATVMTFWART